MHAKFLQLCHWFRVSPRWFLFNLVISFATSVAVGFLSRGRLETLHVLFLLPLLLSPAIQVKRAQNRDDSYFARFEREFVAGTINMPLIVVGFFISEWLWKFLEK